MTQVIKLMCPNMHKIVSYKGGYKRVKSQEQTVVERTTVMNCSASKEDFDSKEAKGFCSCLQACDYILNPRYSRCLRCPRMLEIFFRKPPKYGGNDQGNWFSCTYCRTSHGYYGNSVEGSAYLRCDKCDTDICRNCCPVLRDPKNPNRFYP